MCPRPAAPAGDPIPTAGGRLAGGLLDGSGCRTLAGDVLRRLLCDNPTVELFVTPGGKLDLGRRTRRVTATLRRALNIRDPHCQWPGCYRTVCHAHHLRPWTEGGPTPWWIQGGVCPRPARVRG